MFIISAAFYTNMHILLHACVNILRQISWTKYLYFGKIVPYCYQAYLLFFVRKENSTTLRNVRHLNCFEDYWNFFQFTILFKQLNGSKWTARFILYGRLMYLMDKNVSTQLSLF